MGLIDEIVQQSDGSYALADGHHRSIIPYLLYGEDAHVLAWRVSESPAGTLAEPGPSVPDVVHHIGRNGLARLVQVEIWRLDRLERNKTRQRLHKLFPSLFPTPTTQNTGLDDSERERPVLRGYILRTSL